MAIEDVRKNNDIHVQDLKFNREYIQRRYNTDYVYSKWIKILEELNEQYPTIESRSFAKKYFVSICTYRDVFCCYCRFICKTGAIIKNSRTLCYRAR